MCLSCRWIDFIIDMALAYHQLPPTLSLLLSIFFGDTPLVGVILSALGLIAMGYLLMRTLEDMAATTTVDDPTTWADSATLLVRFILLMSLVGALLGPLMALDPWLPVGLLLAFGLFLLTGQPDTLISRAAEEGIVALLRPFLRAPRR